MKKRSPAAVVKSKKKPAGTTAARSRVVAKPSSTAGAKPSGVGAVITSLDTFAIDTLAYDCISFFGDIEIDTGTKFIPGSYQMADAFGDFMSNRGSEVLCYLHSQLEPSMQKDKTMLKWFASADKRVLALVHKILKTWTDDSLPATQTFVLETGAGKKKLKSSNGYLETPTRLNVPAFQALIARK